MAAGEAKIIINDDAAIPVPARRSDESIQYVRLGGLPEAYEGEVLALDGGISCYEAVFTGGRIRILTEGLDLAAAERALAKARAERQRPHLLVGRLVGIGSDGTPRLVVGYAVPLFAYGMEDIELAASDVPPLQPAPAPTAKAGRRDLRVAA